MVRKIRHPESEMVGLVDGQRPSTSGSSNVNLNLDYLTRPRVSVLSGNDSTKKLPGGRVVIGKRNRINRPRPLCEFLSSYTAMMCYYYPTLCSCCFIGLLLGFVVLLGKLTLFNQMVEFGDLSSLGDMEIKSKYDLTIGKVDHWCLRGGNEGCNCADPLTPSDRSDHRSWLLAVKENEKMIDEIIKTKRKIDVAILGESVVEAMGGRWMGLHGGSGMAKRKKKFEKKFGNSTGGVSELSTVSGVALGVAGDTTPNVLWRLLKSELKDRFEPQVWWVSLGMNDLARSECSEEITLLGILRVVEEIMSQRPDAFIVINSILPMADVRGGAYPILSDYSDAFKDPDLRVQISTEETTNSSPPENRYRWRRLLESHAEAEKVEEEEKERDKKLRRQKESADDDELNDKKRVRKFSVRRRRGRLPLWTSIRAINDKLRSFVEKQNEKKGNHRIRFVDVTTLFAEERSQKWRIKKNFITKAGYPRPRGFEEWEDKITREVKTLLDIARKKAHATASTDDPINGEDDDAMALDDSKNQDDDQA